jgi:uncharacterized membrane protein YeaQ/YmgE (transglycosylase-associated protein family)
MSLIAYVLALLLSGLIVGALGRLAIPGRDPMSIPQTILVGLVASFVAGIASAAVLGRHGASVLLSVVVAAGIVYLVRRSRGRRVEPHRFGARPQSPRP